MATNLLFDKHVEYVANHGNDKNDFVSIVFLMDFVVG